MTVLLASLADWWGLSLPASLLLLAVLLFLVDLFLTSEFLNYVAYGFIALAVALYVPVPVLVKLIIGVACWMGLASGHYWIWRNFIERFTDHVLAPTRFQQGADALVGQMGKVRIIDGRRMVAVQGDLWVFDGPADLPDGAQVQIIGQDEGTLKVKPHWEG